MPATLPIGAGTEIAQNVAQKWDTIDEQMEEVHHKGFIWKDPPLCACPELTSEMLTTTDTKSYTETYTQLNAWFGYASETYALVQASILQFENMKDILEAEGRKVAREINEGTKKPTVEELKDRMMLNPEYQDVLRKLQRFKQSKLLFSAKLESIERSLRVVSRQVEIRRLDQDQTRNGANMPGRGMDFTGGGRFGNRPGSE